MAPVSDCDRTEHKWNVFRDIVIDRLNTVAPLRRVRDRQLTAPPVSAETQQLLQRRKLQTAKLIINKCHPSKLVSK